MKHSAFLFLYVVLLTTPLMLKAQQPSVRVNADHTVTLSLNVSKDVDDVVLKGSLATEIKRNNVINQVFRKQAKVSIDGDNGHYTYTTKSLPSDLYTYCFEVDDIDTLMPYAVKPTAEQLAALRAKARTDTAGLGFVVPDSVRDGDTWYNWFVIPGGDGDNYLPQANVAHGKVEAVWYPSSIEGMSRRRMMVYTPPRYDGTHRYPVLYLLHGTGGDETSWLMLGRAAQILDNLISDHRCQPMIVVMTNENADRAAAPGFDPYNTSLASSSATPSMFGITESAFVKDIVGYVDSHYATLADKGHRAIAGVSLGGMHTLFITANNPQTFGYVGLFSALINNEFSKPVHISKINKAVNRIRSIGRYIPSVTTSKPGRSVTEISQYANKGKLAVYDSLDVKLQRQFATPPALYYIAIGINDPLLSQNDDYRTLLNGAHYKFTYHESNGGHEWYNWRRYLVDFLPKLFKSNQ